MSDESNKVLPGRFFWDKKKVIERNEVQKANLDTGIIETIVDEKSEWVDVPMIKITIDAKTTLVREVTDEDKRQRRQQWENFSNKAEYQTDGTPLEEWAGVTPAIIETLRGLGILSVEQLAELPESTARQFMGGLTYREKAKAYIASKSVGGIEAIAEQSKRMQEENDALKQQIADQRGQFAELSAQVEALKSRQSEAKEIVEEAQESPKRSKKRSGGGEAQAAA